MLNIEYSVQEVTFSSLPEGCPFKAGADFYQKVQSFELAPGAVRNAFKLGLPGSAESPPGALVIKCAGSMSLHPTV
jgi:hypothetical protein